MFAKAFSHVRRHWMGALALFLVLSGGTAAALDGSNTVFSDDIVNKQVRQADLKPTEPWHEVSSLDTFSGGVLQWINWGAGRDTVGFYRDPYGVVHVKGFLCVHDVTGVSGCNTGGGPIADTTAIFTLPTGYRPDNTLELPTSSQGDFARAEIKPDGTVSADGSPPWHFEDFYLDGISFRCAPSGQHGCP